MTTPVLPSRFGLPLAIHKREDIAVKYKSAKYTTRDARQQNITKGAQTKMIKQASSKLQKLEKSIQDANASVANAREDLSAIQLVLADITTKFNGVLQQKEYLEQEVSESEWEKNRYRAMIDLHNQLLERYERLENGDVPPVNVSARAEFEVNKMSVRCLDKLDKLSNIINALAMKHDQYESIFDRMNELCQSSFG